MNGDFRFQVGDAVHLRTGGPAMTVCRAFHDYENNLQVYDVAWFIYPQCVMVNGRLPEGALIRCEGNDCSRDRASEESKPPIQ